MVGFLNYRGVTRHHVHSGCAQVVPAFLPCTTRTFARAHNVHDASSSTCAGTCLRKHTGREVRPLTARSFTCESLPCEGQEEGGIVVGGPCPRHRGG